jgi:hypothetical protein
MKQRSEGLNLDFSRIVFASFYCGKLVKKSFEDSFCVSAATSLKNETEVTSIVLVSVSSSLKNEIVFPLSV